MASSWSMDWRGPAVQMRVLAAVKAGLNETGLDSVNAAKEISPYLTGNLRRSIVMEPARQEGNATYMQWGASADYALWLEIGTSRMRAQPYLRPAAAVTYPLLIDKIRRNL